MAKEILAVYEPRQVYLERFLSYANSKTRLSFEIQGFTDLTILANHMRNNKIKAVLLSQDTIAHVLINSGGDDKQVSIFSDVMLFILGEQPGAGGELPEEWKTCDRVSWIYRYQSAGNILAEIRSCMEETALQSTGDHPMPGVQLSVLYSPADKVSHPEAAAELIRSGSMERQQVLYVNLEQFSGMREVLETPVNASLTEVLYIYRTSPGRLAETLNRTKGRYRDMDVLLAPEHLEDLEVVGEEGWPDFLNALSRAGDYQHILIDMSFFNIALIDVGLGYGTLYIPAVPYPGSKTCRSVLSHRRDPDPWEKDLSQAKLREFRQFFMDQGREEDLNKILEVHLD